MKTKLLLVSAMLGLAMISKAQIPNNGFENWVTIGNSAEPTIWHSMYSLIDSTGSYCPVTKSTDHYPASIGSYSVRIANDTAKFHSGISPSNMLGWGMLVSTKMNDKPLFPITGHPKSLCGYYKFVPQNGDTMNIAVHFYKNGIEITMGQFQSHVAAANWTSFKVYVADTLYSSVDSARISLSSCNEPKNGLGGPRGNSVLYIDNLSFDNLITSTASVAEQSAKNTLFNLFPNPASDVVTLNFIQNISADMTLNIYNVNGELISSKLLQQNQKQINIGDLNSGIYLVEIKSKGLTESQKLVIQR